MKKKTTGSDFKILQRLGTIQVKRKKTRKRKRENFGWNFAMKWCEFTLVE